MQFFAYVFAVTYITSAMAGKLMLTNRVTKSICKNIDKYEETKAVTGRVRPFNGLDDRQNSEDTQCPFWRKVCDIGSQKCSNPWIGQVSCNNIKLGNEGQKDPSGEDIKQELLTDVDAVRLAENKIINNDQDTNRGQLTRRLLTCGGTNTGTKSAMVGGGVTNGKTAAGTDSETWPYNINEWVQESIRRFGHRLTPVLFSELKYLDTKAKFQKLKFLRTYLTNLTTSVFVQDSTPDIIRSGMMWLGEMYRVKYDSNYPPKNARYSPTTWTVAIFEYLDLLEDARQFYDFVSLVDSYLSSIDFQNMKSLYNVADINDWGKSRKPQGINITNANFDTFMEKAAHTCNIYVDSKLLKLRAASIWSSLLLELNQVLDRVLKSSFQCVNIGKSLIVFGTNIVFSEIFAKCKVSNLESLIIMGYQTISIDMSFDSKSYKTQNNFYLVMITPEFAIQGDAFINIQNSVIPSNPNNIAGAPGIICSNVALLYSNLWGSKLTVLCNKQVIVPPNKPIESQSNALYSGRNTRSTSTIQERWNDTNNHITVDCILKSNCEFTFIQNYIDNHVITTCLLMYKFGALGNSDMYILGTYKIFVTEELANNKVAKNLEDSFSLLLDTESFLEFFKRKQNNEEFYVFVRSLLVRIQYKITATLDKSSLTQVALMYVDIVARNILENPESLVNSILVVDIVNAFRRHQQQIRAVKIILENERDEVNQMIKDSEKLELEKMKIESNRKLAEANLKLANQATASYTKFIENKIKAIKEDATNLLFSISYWTGRFNKTLQVMIDATDNHVQQRYILNPVMRASSCTFQVLQFRIPFSTSDLDGTQINTNTRSSNRVPVELKDETDIAVKELFQTSKKFIEDQKSFLKKAMDKCNNQCTITNDLLTASMKELVAVSIPDISAINNSVTALEEAGTFCLNVTELIQFQKQNILDTAQQENSNSALHAAAYFLLTELNDAESAEKLNVTSMFPRLYWKNHLLTVQRSIKELSLFFKDIMKAQFSIKSNFLIQEKLTFLKRWLYVAVDPHELHTHKTGRALHSLETLESAFNFYFKSQIELDEYKTKLEQAKLIASLSRIPYQGNYADIVSQTNQIDPINRQENYVIARCKTILFSQQILERHNIILTSFKLWVFPFADLLWDHSSFSENTNLKAIETLQFMDSQIDQLILKIEEYKQTISPLDEFQRNAIFNPNCGTPAVYSWSNTEYAPIISDFLDGKPISVEANIVNSPTGFDAIKFKEILLFFKSTNDSALDMAIESELTNFELHMTTKSEMMFRLGKNYYSVPAIPVRILRSFKEVGGRPVMSNEVYRKLSLGEYMLGPYTKWELQIKPIRPNAESNQFNVLSKFKNQVDMVMVGDVITFVGSIDKLSKIDEYYSKYEIKE